MEFLDGKGCIVAYDDEAEEECSYEIDQITATFEEDIDDVVGVLRCTGVTIESDAPGEINWEAGEELYNEIADVEFNDADRDGAYIEEAEEYISRLTGVDTDAIVIEEE